MDKKQPSVQPAVPLGKEKPAPKDEAEKLETQVYTFKTKDSLDKLIASDKHHRVRPEGGLEMLKAAGM